MRGSKKIAFVTTVTLLSWGIYFLVFYPSIDARLLKGIELVSGFFMLVIYLAVHLIAKVVWRIDPTQSTRKVREIRLLGLPLPQVNVLTGGLLFFGVLSFASGLNDMRNTLTSMSWSATTGVILSAATSSETQSLRGSDASSISRGDTRQITSHWVYVRYRYEVDGAKFEASRARFGSPLGGNATDAREALERHAEGKQVTVYYDPQSPDQSVLYRHVEKGVIFITTVGALLLAAGIALVAARVRMLMV